MKFKDKLTYIMNELNIISAELARKVFVDPAQVCRWRSGKRIPKDEATIAAISACFLSATKTKYQRELLNSLLSEYDMPDLTLDEKLAIWLFDESPVTSKDNAGGPSNAGTCYLGVEGFITAIELLERKVARRLMPTPISIYITLDQVNLLLDTRLSAIWQRLGSLKGGPITIILEQPIGSLQLQELFVALLPHMQSGRLQLYHLTSSEHRFCYGITVLAKETGMTISLEPPGVLGPGIAMYIDDPSFINSMGAVLENYGNAARPMLKFIHDENDEFNHLRKCYSGKEALYAIYGSLNPLYAEPSEYGSLLAANGISGEDYKNKLSRFERLREDFISFLTRSQYNELIYILEAADTQLYILPGTFDFAKNEPPVIPMGFALSVFSGMAKLISEYDNFNVMLARGEYPAPNITHIKEDSFLLMQTSMAKSPVRVLSESWLLINGFLRHFDELQMNCNSIYGKENLLYELNRRVKKLEALI